METIYIYHIQDVITTRLQVSDILSSLIKLQNYFFEIQHYGFYLFKKRGFFNKHIN